MHVALTVDPELPVPPRFYGGIERIVDMLARGLVDRGHAVTLFAHPDSRSAGELVPWPGTVSGSRSDTLRNGLALARGVVARRCDIVHSFSRIAYLLPLLPLPIPKLMTYQRAITPRSVRLGHGLSRGTLQFTAISRWMMRDVAHLARWHMVPNGVPLARFDFRPATAPDAPLVFLGRVEEIKGPHLAIEVARRTGLPLVIAGNVPPEHQAWFDANIAPLVDGARVSFVGPVDDAQKNALLGRARAFLMPILWEEPFGIVMAEAMACGVPVIGLGRGAVPEVVEDGVTGFVCADVEEMVAAVGRLPGISRAACRARAARLYSEEAVLEGYLAVYRAMLPRDRRAPAAAALPT
jgi:glycosyltransferase involved in cell wall biosynthesis